MFAENLLESGPHTYASRAKSTFASFGLQMGLVALLVALPVIFPMALPIVMAPAPTTVTLVKQQSDTVQTTSRPKQSAIGPVSVLNRDLITPSRIPNNLPTNADPVGPTVDVIGVNIGHGPTGPSSINIIGETVAPQIKPVVPTKPIKVSDVQLGSIINRVQPRYPAMAIPIRLQGDVIVRAIIGRDGSMQEVQAVSGHPMLTPAAIEAVKQWRYRPYILNGQAVEVETQITVRFRMGEH
jgi:protein TonB